MNIMMVTLMVNQINLNPGEKKIEQYYSVISEDKGFYRFDLFSGGFEKKRCRRGAS